MATILVADDEPAIATLLADILEADGHTVMLAHDGREALALAEAQRPDVILSDVMMPFLDGIGLCRALRQRPGTRRIPVLLMSAASPPAGWQTLANGFLAKPFDFDAVCRLVWRYGAGERREVGNRAEQVGGD